MVAEIAYAAMTLAREAFTMYFAPLVAAARSFQAMVVNQLEENYDRNEHLIYEQRQVSVPSSGEDSLTATFRSPPVVDAITRYLDVADSLGRSAAEFTVDYESVNTRDEDLAIRVSSILDQAKSSLSDDDRMILRLLFWHGRRVPEIARDLSLDQKTLYKRIDRAMEALHRVLEIPGISRDDIANLLSPGIRDYRSEDAPDDDEHETNDLTTRKPQN